MAGLNFGNLLDFSQPKTSGASASLVPLTPVVKKTTPKPAAGVGGAYPIAGGVPTTNNQSGTPAVAPATAAPDDSVNAAQLALEAQINAAKQQASDIRNEGQNTFNSLLSNINAYRQRAQQAYTDANTNIVGDANNNVAGQASSAIDNAADVNRIARGLGLSSAINLGQKFQNARASTVGNIRAAETTNKNQNQQQLNTENDNADTQESQANDYLKQINDQANEVENGGFGSALSGYTNALNDIVNYQRSLASINPLSAGSITTLTPDFSSVVNTLNNVLSGAGVTGTTTPTSANSNANPVNPVDIATLLKSKGLLNPISG